MAIRNYPPDHPPFAALPVRTITIGTGANQLAVHISGRLSSRRVPVICVPGYQRNMTDFTDFIRYFGRLAGESWPVILVDLFGRGRSTFLRLLGAGRERRTKHKECDKRRLLRRFDH